MCQKLEGIEVRIAENNSDLTNRINDGTLTTGSKATWQTELDSLYLERRDHKFFGHDGLGCPDA